MCPLYTSSLYKQFGSRKGQEERYLKSDIWNNFPSKKKKIENKIKENLFFTHLPYDFHTGTGLLYIKVAFHAGCFVFKETSTNMAKLHKMCNKNVTVNLVKICGKSNNKILLPFIYCILNIFLLGNYIIPLYCISIHFGVGYYLID